MGRFPLTEVIPYAPADISSRFLMLDRSQSEHKSEHTRVLVVEFAGEYPHGSSGNAHGAYVATTALRGLQVFEPYCVVLDFRALSYQWGNTIYRVFSDIAQWMDSGNGPSDPPFPVLIVGSERSRGLRSLIASADGALPPTYFEDLDEALEAAIKAAHAWIDA